MAFNGIPPTDLSLNNLTVSRNLNNTGVATLNKVTALVARIDDAAIGDLLVDNASFNSLSAGNATINTLTVTEQLVQPDNNVTVPITVTEFLLDLNEIKTTSNTRFVQSTTDVAVLCVWASSAPSQPLTFTVQTNAYGFFVLCNTGVLSYKSNVYLPPNQVVNFEYSNGELRSSVGYDVSFSPTLAWISLFAASLTTPPPKTSRFLATMALGMYESLVQFSATMLDLAIVNEVGKLVMANYLPLVNTNALYDQFPKLSVVDLGLVSAFITNLITVTLAYNPVADSAVYVGPPPLLAPPFLWTGSNPVLPNWSLSGYVGNGFAFTPTITDPSTLMYADSQQLIQLYTQGLTQQQKEIATYFVRSPPAHLIEMACELLSTVDWSEAQYAQSLALIAMSVSNAGTVAWITKYEWWSARPFQYIPAVFGVPFTPYIPTPNFPSAVSGHSTFSGAWAATVGLCEPRFRRVADFIASLSGVSRIYGGIHYEEADNVPGLQLGRDSATQLYNVLLTQIKTFATFV